MGAQAAPPPLAVFPPQPPVFPPVPPSLTVPLAVAAPAPQVSIAMATPAFETPAPQHLQTPLAPVDTVESETARFEPGDIVQLQGLQKNANLNGQKGTVVVPGTVKVLLDLGPEVAVKPANIKHFKEAA